MPVNFHAEGFQFFLKRDSAGLVGEAGQADAAHIQAIAAEGVDQPEHVQVIGDPQVGADFIFLDIRGVDGDYDLSLILQLRQHVDLAVRFKTRKHAGCVIIVKKFSAELQV